MVAGHTRMWRIRGPIWSGVGPAGTLASTMSAVEPRLRLALVGCGGIADAHLTGAERVGARIEVTAVIEPDDDRRAAYSTRTGAPGFPDLNVALERAGDCFDAVDIMVPHDLHEPVAVAAMSAGKHVLLEKPMAMDLDACDRLLGVAAHAVAVGPHPGRPITFMVAEQSQYWPDVLEARRLIDEGAIGRPVFARAAYFDPGLLPADLEPGRPRPWRFELARSGGGLAIDGGAHWIRPLRILLGEVAEVVAVTGRHIDRMEGESWLQSILRFESGTTATFEAYASAYPIAPAELFRITGDRGELVIPGPDFVDAELRLHNEDHPDGTVVLSSPRGRADSYGLEVADFAEVVLSPVAGAVEPAAAAEASLAELRTAQAIYRSATSGRWEPVG